MAYHRNIGDLRSFFPWQVVLEDQSSWTMHLIYHHLIGFFLSISEGSFIFRLGQRFHLQNPSGKDCFSFFVEIEYEKVLELYHLCSSIGHLL